jgi:hypothetical protein
VVKHKKKARQQRYGVLGDHMTSPEPGKCFFYQVCDGYRNMLQVYCRPRFEKLLQEYTMTTGLLFPALPGLCYRWGTVYSTHAMEHFGHII